MPSRCAACPADMYADHALRLAQEIVTENLRLLLFSWVRGWVLAGGWVVLSI